MKHLFHMARTAHFPSCYFWTGIENSFLRLMGSKRRRKDNIKMILKREGGGKIDEMAQNRDDLLTPVNVIMDFWNTQHSRNFNDYLRD